MLLALETSGNDWVALYGLEDVSWDIGIALSLSRCEAEFNALR
jgi:hypothetical protein